MKDKNLEKDTLTFYLMLRIYCKAKHCSKDTICSECNDLYDYAKNKLQKCPYTIKKPTCSKCRIHCYEHVQREKVKEVMRFSGKIFAYWHPVLAVRHLLQMQKSKKKQ